MVPENKQKKKIQTNQLHWPLKWSPSFSTQCWRPQPQILFWGFCQFLGPTKPSNHNFYGPTLKFFSGAFVLLGRLPNSNFTRGLLPIWGPRAFWGMKLLRTVQSVSTNSWLSVAYLFSIIPRNQIWFSAPEPQNARESPTWAKAPGVKFEFRSLPKRTCPQSKIWCWAPKPQNAPVGPKMGKPPE
jgi:hypothetical protein